MTRLDQAETISWCKDCEVGRHLECGKNGDCGCPFYHNHEKAAPAKEPGTNESFMNREPIFDEGEPEYVEIRITPEARAVLGKWLSVGYHNISEAIIAADSMGETIRREFLREKGGTHDIRKRRDDTELDLGSDI